MFHPQRTRASGTGSQSSQPTNEDGDDAGGGGGWCVSLYILARHRPAHGV